MALALQLLARYDSVSGTENGVAWIASRQFLLLFKIIKIGLLSPCPSVTWTFLSNGYIDLFTRVNVHFFLIKWSHVGQGFDQYSFPHLMQKKEGASKWSFLPLPSFLCLYIIAAYLNVLRLFRKLNYSWFGNETDYCNNLLPWNGKESIWPYGEEFHFPALWTSIVTMCCVDFSFVSYLS